MAEETDLGAEIWKMFRGGFEMAAPRYTTNGTDTVHNNLPGICYAQAPVCQHTNQIIRFRTWRKNRENE
jgi:hypothetical protein